MYNRIYFFLIFIGFSVLLVPTPGRAQVLSGDVAILGINSSDPAAAQRWAFVVMRLLPAGTVLHFTDAGIDDKGQFYISNSTEGHMTWSLPSAIPAGKVMVVTNNNTGGNATVRDLQGTIYAGVTGTVGGSNSAFGTSGDQLFVYQGTSGSTTGASFLYGFNNSQDAQNAGIGKWVISGNINKQWTSYEPSSLGAAVQTVLTVNGTSTVSNGSGVFGFDNMRYNGITSGTRTALLDAIKNPLNWVGNDATPYNLPSLLSDFTITDLLPVKLSSFTGSRTGHLHTLVWTTAMEEQAESFQLERSTDGRLFVQIASIQVKGRPSSYSFSEKSTDKTTYYRLKMTDLDQRFTYSQIIRIVQGNELPTSFSVYPNPVRSGQPLTVEGGYPSAMLVIRTMDGRLIEKKTWRQGETLETAKLPSGMYLLEWSHAGKIDRSRLLVR